MRRLGHALSFIRKQSIHIVDYSGGNVKSLSSFKKIFFTKRIDIYFHGDFIFGFEL